MILHAPLPQNQHHRCTVEVVPHRLESLWLGSTTCPPLPIATLVVAPCVHVDACMPSSLVPSACCRYRRGMAPDLASVRLPPVRVEQLMTLYMHQAQRKLLWCLSSCCGEECLYILLAKLLSTCLQYRELTKTAACVNGASTNMNLVAVVIAGTPPVCCCKR